jgi:YHS domain-containing protein
MAVDPICGMQVDEASALRAERDGQTWFFCCDHCRQKFLASPPAPPTVSAGTYTCPMHPEIEQDHPGPCPKCGMDLEPKIPAAADDAQSDGDGDMARRFWVGLALSVPLMILAMREMMGFRVFEETRFYLNYLIQLGLGARLAISRIAQRQYVHPHRHGRARRLSFQRGQFGAVARNSP